jgi:hypothetical protein
MRRKMRKAGITTPVSVDSVNQDNEEKYFRVSYVFDVHREKLNKVGLDFRGVAMKGRRAKFGVLILGTTGCVVWGTVGLKLCRPRRWGIV